MGGPDIPKREETPVVTPADPAVEAAGRKQRQAELKRKGRAALITNQGDASGLGDVGLNVERKALLGQ
jgi:hypothetical protein